MLFFFSSRRRHTRYIGDWSSDVCSSDLVGRARGRRQGCRRSRRAAPDDARRSEERRVGKECGARWAPHHEKKRVGQEGNLNTQGEKAVRQAKQKTNTPNKQTGGTNGEDK